MSRKIRQKAMKNPAFAGSAFAIIVPGVIAVFHGFGAG
jgi:hypothetical protein